MQASLHSTLADNAAIADSSTDWPGESWNAIRRAGICRWNVPAEFGGASHAPVDLLAGYVDLASACLTTAFLLSQRDAAVRRIAQHGSPTMRSDLLPALAEGTSFATVGLSQLTTSRQHAGPTLRATLDDEYLRLDGVIPWVTGAPRSDHVVVGAVLADGRQVLAVLPRKLDGVEVGSPLELMALQGSQTCEVRLHGVKLPRRWLLAGPAEKVMSVGRGGTGGLETSALALGLAQAATTYLDREATLRPELVAVVRRFADAGAALRTDLVAGLDVRGDFADAAIRLRSRANSLVLRSTQAALAASKGAGFLRSHPAQRWVRQATFFLVWSCPRPAVDVLFDDLSCSILS